MASYSIDVSSELMENYVQSDVLLPQDKFLALQTEAGASLLFSIGSGGVLNLTIEEPGQNYGWRQVGLAGTWTVKSFGAAQSQDGKQIHLVAVVDDGQQDHVYISFANSASDLAWTANPGWTQAPFNAVGGDGTPVPAPSPLKIADVFISEATDGDYIVVDVIETPGQQPEVLLRFYLDITTPASPLWTQHALGTDFEAAGYSSCLGRSASSFDVDGLYTKGVIDSASQLIYTPLYNKFGKQLHLQPHLSRLNLPGGAFANAIAAARGDDQTSDLFVAAAGSLYHFASTNQKDGALGILVANSALLNGVRSLYACVADGVVTVWGLNGNGQVFYLRCPSSQLDQEASWSTPLPIVTGADAISPYIDRGYSSNTFFAHTGTGLVKLVKSPTTGLWSQRNITLAPSAATRAATAVHSYTTHVKVTGADGQAATGVSVTLNATNVTSVYINHLYRIIGPSPIEIPTDELGTITIVETTGSLAGTRFTMSIASQPAITHNTMDSAWQRNARYTTTDSLQSAQIVARDGTTRKFIPDGTSQDDLQRVADSNAALATVYANLSSAPAPAVRALTAIRLAKPPRPVAALALGGFLDGLETDIGDLFCYVASTVEAAVDTVVDAVEVVVDVVEDAAESAWHFVATIGGTVYHAALDTVEAVVAAATWVYNAVKVAVEDVIEFLQFLFGWQDILVTHKVLKNVFLCLARSAITDASALSSTVTQAFAQAKGTIDAWAGISNIDGSATATLTRNPPLAMQNSAPANLGVHHFQNNCRSSSSDVPVSNPADDIFKGLITVMEQQVGTLTEAADTVKTNIIDNFSDIGVAGIIEQILDILATGILDVAGSVLTTSLDVFAQLLDGAVEILTAKLDIPVLSWLYNQLTGEDLSILDVICLIAAIPVTVIYKAAAERAPFPADDPFTSGLLGASTIADVHAQFLAAPSSSQGVRRLPNTLSAAAVLTGSDDGAVLNQTLLKRFGFATGIVALVGSVALVAIVNWQRASEPVRPLPPEDRPMARVRAVLAAAANLAYVSPNLASLLNFSIDNDYAQINNYLTYISVAKSLAAIGAVDCDESNVGDLFAFSETFINLFWNVPVIANIAMNCEDAGSTYQSLIPESIGNFAFNVGGILELPINITPAESPAQAGLIVAQAGLMMTYALCTIAAGSIYEFTDGQSH